MASPHDIEPARLSMLAARKALEDYETLNGFASSCEHTRLTQVFTKATQTYLTGISILVPKSPTLYTPRGVPSHYFSLAGSRSSGQGSVYPIASPETADCGLPMRFCQTPLRPW
jgi:hypothetical protein